MQLKRDLKGIFRGDMTKCEGKGCTLSGHSPGIRNDARCCSGLEADAEGTKS